jgi:hypothetical protein
LTRALWADARAFVVVVVVVVVVGALLEKA